MAETLDDGIKTKIILRRIDERIMHNEFRIGQKKHKVENPEDD